CFTSEDDQADTLWPQYASTFPECSGELPFIKLDVVIGRAQLVGTVNYHLGLFGRKFLDKEVRVDVGHAASEPHVKKVGKVCIGHRVVIRRIGNQGVG